MINNYQDAPLFATDVELSGVDVNILRNNAIFLDGFTQQPIPIFPENLYREAYQGMFPDPTNGKQPWLTRLSFRYEPGLTNAVYEVNGIPVTNERLRIYHRSLNTVITDVNAPGTLVHDVAFPSSNTTVTINITGAGYVYGEIIEVYVFVYFPGPTFPKTGAYFMRNAYVTAVSDLVSAYPGVPSFSTGTSLSEANLNQLANAQDWIMSYLSLIPRIPFEAGMFVLGTHKDTTANNNNPRLLYLGEINKGNGQNTFQATIDYYIFNGSEVVQIYINGVKYYESSALLNGETGTLNISFDISALSNAANHTVTVWQEVAAGEGQMENSLYGNSIIDSRFTIRKMEVTHSRSYYTPSAEIDVLESMTYATLRGRLNNFVSGTTAAYTRITGNANIFNRIRMFRRKFGWNERQLSSLDWVNLPTQIRIGERFIVAGKDIKIAWGGYTITSNFLEEPSKRDIYEFARTEQLTSSDKVEVKEGYFEQFKDLYVGTTYYILGAELSYFGEYLR